MSATPCRAASSPSAPMRSWMWKINVFDLGKDKKANHKEEKKMKYDQKINLKNGKEAWLRNGDVSDIRKK